MKWLIQIIDDINKFIPFASFGALLFRYQSPCEALGAHFPSADYVFAFNSVPWKCMHEAIDFRVTSLTWAKYETHQTRNVEILRCLGNLRLVFVVAPPICTIGQNSLVVFQIFQAFESLKQTQPLWNSMFVLLHVQDFQAAPRILRGSFGASLRCAVFDSSTVWCAPCCAYCIQHVL